MASCLAVPTPGLPNDASDRLMVEYRFVEGGITSGWLRAMMLRNLTVLEEELHFYPCELNDVVIIELVRL